MPIITTLAEQMGRAKRAHPTFCYQLGILKRGNYYRKKISGVAQVTFEATS